MLLPSRVAGRTLDLRGPDLAREPEVARPCPSRFHRLSCGIVISILGDIADDLHHFICVTVLDQR